MKQYQEIIDSYEKGGIIENGSPGKVHYLPHRSAIRNDRETTKVLSYLMVQLKKKEGKSLNDLLHPGPCLLSHTYDILIRFCFGKIAIISDIQQAFLHVEICEQDKNFLRFLYVNPNDDAEIQMFRFNRVCFGITSSPFLLSATIKHHMNMLKTEQPELTDKFMSGIYVGDITSTVNTVDEGVEFFEFPKQPMASAGLHLRKWFSNSKELCGRMGCIQADPKLRKVLGVSWKNSI